MCFNKDRSSHCYATVSLVSRAACLIGETPQTDELVWTQEKRREQNRTEESKYKDNKQQLLRNINYTNDRNHKMLSGSERRKTIVT
jgi:hypothetical protein